MGICISVKPSLSYSTPTPQGQGSSSSIKSPSFEFDFIPENKNKITTEYLITSEVLGKGAFGVVRKCIHLITNQARAIKIISKNKCSKVTNEKKKFLSEINILKQLNHPNIVRIYEYFQDEEYIFIVMEIVPGIELLEKIMDVHHMSERKSAMVIQQILITVNYLHSKKIVHRDIKPENILFDGTHVKLIDFGTATFFSKNHKMKSLNGTPYYIAPEVINGSYNELCDVWSCGIILYILLTGVPPFSGKTDREIFAKIQKREISFLRPEFSQVSENGKLFLKRLLTHNYKKRPSVAEALTDNWFNSVRSRKTLVIEKSFLDNLKSFYVTNQFQKAIYLFVINNIASNSEKNELIKTFEALDLNQDGVLSKQEIKIGLNKVGIFLNDQEVQDIMNNLGEKDARTINYLEFVAATLDKKKLLDEKRIMHCFKLFDKDKKGKIGINNFKDILQSKTKLTDESWRDMIKVYDINGDGEIEFFEFKEILLKLLN